MSIASATGRVAAVTGATGGIGREIARGLAVAGMRVVLIGRDSERLARIAGWIGAEPGVVMPETVRADLSLLRETREAAERVLEITPRLDVLVNNAGVLVPRRLETAEGHELTLAVNHLSPFVLTRHLLPALRAAEGARVVNTGSSYSDWASVDPDDLQLARSWRMVRAYARSKLCLLMASIALAEQERTRGLCVNVVHPGLVATGLVRSGGIDQLVWSSILRRFALSPEQGADTTLHAALSPAFAGITGRYLKRRVAVTPNRRALDPALRARVMQRTALLAGEP